MELGNGLKKILLAGIGTAATTVEKGQEILNNMVEKGELTIEQGKALNKELKHTIKNSGRKEAKKDMGEKIAEMSLEELEALKAKIAEAEAAKSAQKEEEPKEE